MIYLDNHATTPVAAPVLERMLPWFTEHFGNASSKGHSYGWRADKGVEYARQEVADFLGARPTEIIFTSGATESNNLAIFGAAHFLESKKKHLITQTTEHSAVLSPMLTLKKQGWEVDSLDVDKQGRIDLQQLADTLRDDTALVSIMAANNEIGTVQNLKAIGELCRQHGAWFHSDATQLVGRKPINLAELPVDMLSLSAHKIYGPKGAGALYVRRRSPRVNLTPLFVGGAQERGLRSGTLNVPGIVGLGAAATYVSIGLDEIEKKITVMRSHLAAKLLNIAPAALINGAEIESERLGGNLSICFDGVSAERLILGLRTIAVSSGAACGSASGKPSRVLKAIGLSDTQAYGTLRIGIGRQNTQEELDYFVALFSEVYKKVSSNSDFIPIKE